VRRSPHSISGLQVTHPLYKHLLKYNATKTSEIISRAQPYVQLEEMMKASSNHSVKSSDSGRKLKSTHEAPDYTQDRHRRQPPYKKQALPILSPSARRSYRSMECFTPLNFPINKVFNTFKDHPWVRCRKLIHHNPSLPGSEEYCSHNGCKGHQTIYCWAF